MYLLNTVVVSRKKLILQGASCVGTFFEGQIENSKWNKFLIYDGVKIENYVRKKWLSTDMLSEYTKMLSRRHNIKCIIFFGKLSNRDDLEPLNLFEINWINKEKRDCKRCFIRQYDHQKKKEKETENVGRSFNPTDGYDEEWFCPNSNK